MHMPGFTDSEVGPLSSSAKRKIVFAAACDIPVLLEGETGTGKSYAASAIHKLSKRARASFVPVNCATIPEQLAEAELFGATRGAFTGLHADRVGLISAANQGSLFLDEMLELPPAIQPKLLGFLEDGMIRRLGDIRLFHVDTRVICATHRNVNRSVEDGTLRQDLFYRIAGLRIRLEPLTERRAEFTFIIGYLLRRIGERMGCAPARMPAVSEDLREYLTEQTLARKHPSTRASAGRRMRHCPVEASSARGSPSGHAERTEKGNPFRSTCFTGHTPSVCARGRSGC